MFGSDFQGFTEIHGPFFNPNMPGPPVKTSPRFVLGRENVPCVAEVVNGSLKADCTDFTCTFTHV